MFRIFRLVFIKYTILLVALSFVPAISYAQDKPRIGLTLSGGGAKGLAHIGILQALDSAGLKVDAISGTSMGAIMGSLYAIGYSGKELEQLSRAMDWNQLFLGSPKLEEVSYLQKEDYGVFPLNLPIENYRMMPFTGIIEAQGLWREFGELYLPVYDIQDFSQYDIPFKCIATDLSTGKVVELKSGNIVNTVRASMAIPSIFTAVKYENTKLVDGGVVQNFPVSALKEYDIDYSIGVNLSSGLLDADKLNSPVDVLLQIAFYKDADNIEQQKELCDLLIEPKLEPYNTSSFGYADSIIDIGKKIGDLYYPIFKKLADSLNITQEVTPIPSRYNKHVELIIDDIEVPNQDTETARQLIANLDLPIGERMSGTEISQSIDKAYSTLLYRKISYYLVPTSIGHAKLVVDIETNPSTFLRLGVHYTQFSSIALTTQFSTNYEILKGSQFLLKLNLSENFRAKFRYRQFLNENHSLGLEFNAQQDFFGYSSYDENLTKSLGLQTANSLLGLNLFKVLGHSSALGVGFQKEWVTQRPEIQTEEKEVTKNNFWYSFAYVNKNTLNRRLYPQKGSQLEFTGGFVFGQGPSTIGTVDIDPLLFDDAISNTLDYYPRVELKVTKLVPVSTKVSLIGSIKSGINFYPNDAYLNYFGLGGEQDFIRNQIPFAGLFEFQVASNSIATAQLGMQYEPWQKVFFTLKANSALYDFIDVNIDKWTSDNYINGFSLAAGYATVIGPVEISLLYNDGSKSFGGYVMVGFPF